MTASFEPTDENLREGGHSLGAGYRIHLNHKPGKQFTPRFDNVATRDLYDQTIYTLPDPGQTADLLSKLDRLGYPDYQIHGPSIEDAYMEISDEMTAVSTKRMNTKDPATILKDGASGTEEAEKELNLLTGKRISSFAQWLILFQKRVRIFRRNAFPHLAALLIPVVASGLLSLFLHGFQGAGCSPTTDMSMLEAKSLSTQVNVSLVVGPSSRLSTDAVERISSIFPGGSVAPGTSPGASIIPSSIIPSSIRVVDDLVDFNNYIDRKFANVTPGGFYLGDGSSPSVLAYQCNGDISLALRTQNALNTTLLNRSIATQYAPFAVPFQANQGSTLQFSLYLGLAFAIYPAFFALYPCMERRGHIRALHYSNGVRPLPLWLAYIVWDFSFVFVGSALSIALLSTATGAWYNLSYLFVVFCLYGLASILYGYVISLLAKSQVGSIYPLDRPEADQGSSLRSLPSPPRHRP